MNLDKEIRTSLQRIFIDYQEWARSNSIFHQFLKLDSSIYGFVYLSSFGNYYVIINKNITKELQKEVFLPEVEHIMYDMPDVGYFIGMDMQYSKIEERANEFAKVVGNIFF